MNNFLQKVYDEIAAERWQLTERQFSSEFLGKCETYFAYLKSTGKEPSADAMLHLWGKLNRDRKLYEDGIKCTFSSTQGQLLTDWVAIYGKLQGEVFDAIGQAY
jgi:hypothetical protein